MDILHLIDRLEEELARGRRLPFSDIVMLNEQRLWNVIDTMRISIPREVEEAQRVNRERERIITQAEEQARRIVESKRKQADEMTARHELIRSARAEAEAIVSKAQGEAQRFQTEADSYALEVLGRLEEQLKRVLQTVQNGAELLSGQQATEADADSEA
jgi:cell division septum initiation protein DivIVA